ncbi:hypothetical protein AMJ83_11010 [candidate division WOR_3 bacterium SM23_42]|uniref:Uncharacterized protein n=1 Tax=candidate division WOR_3 bacterium SM23_42 TaxID=1703779 RepID=A0A0S8FQK0_UNCW3|nr:MAG: hypothetical protein AMJ83_11010 [candidate division WOR_3 bacterium SM23_42]
MSTLLKILIITACLLATTCATKSELEEAKTKILRLEKDIIEIKLYLNAQKKYVDTLIVQNIRELQKLDRVYRPTPWPNGPPPPDSIGKLESRLEEIDRIIK